MRVRAILFFVVAYGLGTFTWDVIRETIFVAADGISLLEDPMATQCRCLSRNTTTDRNGGQCHDCGAVWRYHRPDREIVVEYLSDGEPCDLTSSRD